MSLIAQHRPRSASEILDASAQFYRAHLGVLLVIATAVILPPAILRTMAPAGLGPFVSLVGNLLIPVGQGAMILLVKAVLEEGQEISAGEAYRRLGDRTGEMVGAQMMSGILVILGLIVLVIPGILAFAWTSVVGPVVAIERARGSAALGRSRELTRGLTKHVLGTILLAWILMFILIIGASFSLGLLGGVIGLGESATEFISELLFVPLLPLITIPVAFLYYDLRIRNEGADIDAMVAELPAVV